MFLNARPEGDQTFSKRELTYTSHNTASEWPSVDPIRIYAVTDVTAHTKIGVPQVNIYARFFSMGWGNHETLMRSQQGGRRKTDAGQLTPPTRRSATSGDDHPRIRLLVGRHGEIPLCSPKTAGHTQRKTQSTHNVRRSLVDAYG